MNKITPSRALYIKLGTAGAWEKKCFADGTLRLGYFEVPHALAMQKGKSALKQFFMQERGCSPTVAANHANQVYDFYAAEEEVLWFTFSQGALWWCFASPEVEYLGDDPMALAEEGSCLRRVRGAWSKHSLAGTPLAMNGLSGRLTRTAGYKQTICGIGKDELEYLVRRINDERPPLVTEAEQARQHLEDVISRMITELTWKDFELLVELLFSQSGWRRISANGGTQKTLDLELELPLTGERAIVQVKSQTTQAELDKYAASFTGWEHARLFFVYHTGPGTLNCKDQRISVMGRQKLARMVVDQGLMNWVMRKVA